MTVCASLWHRGHVPFLVLVMALSCAALAPPAGAAEAALTLRRGDRILELSLEDLAALPQTTIVTGNEFTDGEVAYTGPLARTVLETLDLDDVEALRFTAANDYAIEIPTRDFDDYDAILAMQADGKPLSRRDKGPLWLMYPFSDHAELRQGGYVNRLIWQLIRIETP